MKTQVPIKEIAECVGLWLAEGDKTTIREVTLTNNSIDVILFFYQRIMKIYKGKNKPRIYVYSPSKRKLYESLNGIKINFYYDFRANRPYYIFRLADTKFTKEWKAIVEKIKNNKTLYPDILRGFFAGEGNIKHDSIQNTKIVRIAQGNRDEFLEDIFKVLKLTFRYEKDKRMYWFSGRRNMHILNNNDIISLHPEKYAKFNKMMADNSTPRKWLMKCINEKLGQPRRIEELTKLLNRDWVSLSYALNDLKKLGKIDFFKDDGKIYWARTSKVKEFNIKRIREILNCLTLPKSMCQIGKQTERDHKTAGKRLRELEKLGLVKCEKGKWVRTEEGERFLENHTWD